MDNKWYMYANEYLDEIAHFCEDFDQNRSLIYSSLDGLQYEMEMSGEKYDAARFVQALEQISRLSCNADKLASFCEDWRVEIEEMSNRQVERSLPAIKNDVLEAVKNLHLTTEEVINVIKVMRDKHISAEQLEGFARHLDEQNVQYFGSDSSDPLDDSEC